MRYILPLILFVLSLGPVYASQADRYFEFAMEKMREGNYAEAYCFLKPLAERGSSKAQYSLGWMYHNGYGLKINDEAAYFWWSQAAEKNPDAQFAIALLFEQGLGVKKDYDKAASYYVSAMQNGSEDAESYIRSQITGNNGKMRQPIIRAMEGKWGQLNGEPASIKSEKANIRSGGSTKNKILFVLNKGDQIQILAQEGKWYFMVHQEKARTGWVHRSLVLKASDQQ